MKKIVHYRPVGPDLRIDFSSVNLEPEPILAVILVLLGIKFPPILEPNFELIAKANSGVAVFAAGLTLSGMKFQLA